MNEYGELCWRGCELSWVYGLAMPVFWLIVFPLGLWFLSEAWEWLRENIF